MFEELRIAYIDEKKLTPEFRHKIFNLESRIKYLETYTKELVSLISQLLQLLEEDTDGDY